VTLPERVLRLLAAVDRDRARAIVRLAEGSPVETAAPRPRVELAAISPDRALIFVADSRKLARLPWLRLVPVAPGRHLLSLLPGTSIEKLELSLGDLIEELTADEGDERELLEGLLRCLRAPRRSQRVVKEELLFVDLAQKRRAG
jgi:hypothetical protein